MRCLTSDFSSRLGSRPRRTAAPVDLKSPAALLARRRTPCNKPLLHTRRCSSELSRPHGTLSGHSCACQQTLTMLVPARIRCVTKEKKKKVYGVCIDIVKYPEWIEKELYAWTAPVMVAQRFRHGPRYFYADHGLPVPGMNPY